ncbi:MAG: DUF427 domain-containing protein [Chloroflexota bacterium]
MSSKIPSWLQQAQDAWSFRGQKRPGFAIEPGPGQESVWDYPRPPAMVPDSRHVIVKAGDLLIADSTATIRICETASPPAFYIPPQDVKLDSLAAAPGSSFCEWKGPASYWQLASGGSNEPIGWSYPNPLSGSEAVMGFFSFYPGRVECYVDGKRVRPQAGGFYGGWITDEIVGPFKGDPGTSGW